MYTMHNSFFKVWKLLYQLCDTSKKPVYNKNKQKQKHGYVKINASVFSDWFWKPLFQHVNADQISVFATISAPIKGKPCKK